MKNLIKIIIGLIMIFVFKILSQFKKFKFFHLYSSRIGHLTLNFDAALLSVEKNTIIIFITDKTISNNFILDFYKKQKKVFFINSSFMLKIFYCMHLANSNSSIILNFKNNLIDRLKNNANKLQEVKAQKLQKIEDEFRN